MLNPNAEIDKESLSHDSRDSVPLSPQPQKNQGKVATHWHRFIDSFKQPEKSHSSTLDDLEDACSMSDESNHLQASINPISQAFIALGGCVGSGLLVVSGVALHDGGPAGILIGWAIVSTFLYCVMQGLAELASTFPVSGAFAVYATRFVDSSFGFATGWNYALFWVIVLPLELVAASLSIDFWHSDINSVAWVAIFYVVIISLNLLGGTGGFQYTELVASIIKLLGIVGFDILAIVLICGGAGNGFIGAKHWHNPGAFSHGFKGVIAVLVSATYSLAGTELVALTTAESKVNPRIALPSAIKMVFYRIIVFYMITLTLITFLVPYNESQLVTGSQAFASPFVIAIEEGGITALASIINVVILVSLLSIGNSAVYGFSRTILSLAEQGLAPSIFKYVDRRGRPLFGIAVSAFIGLLAFVAASPKEGDVFAWLVAISALSTLFTWMSSSLAHVRFRMALKKQGRDTSELPYVSLTGFWGSVYSSICLFAVLCFQFWTSLFPLGESPAPTKFFQNYLGAVIVFVFLVSHKLYCRITKGNWDMITDLSQLDIDSGRRETDFEKLQQELAEERAVANARPWYWKVYYFLF